MTEETNSSNIKVTDHRHFDPSGERRRGAEAKQEPAPARVPAPGSAPPRSEASSAAGAPPRARASAQSGVSDLAAGLSSSFSLLVARLAQETEIYLGLVPFPGKESPEPDFEAARAMIDMLSMLEEKTRGNLETEEARLIGDLIYTYRLEFVQRAPGGGVKR